MVEWLKDDDHDPFLLGITMGLLKQCFLIQRIVYVHTNKCMINFLHLTVPEIYPR